MSQLPADGEAEAAASPDAAPGATAEADPHRTIGVIPTELVHPIASSPTLSSSMGGAAPMFKPMQDNRANWSVIMSSLGFVLCLFPVLSLSGLLLGLHSQRRIAANNGELTGEKTARLGVRLGAAGFIIGVTIDLIFVLTR